LTPVSALSGDDTGLRRARARAQLLHRPPGLTAAAAVRHLLAVQAQDPRSARLALRARLGAVPPDDDALVVTWLVRGTLHLVHRDDLPWLHALTAPGRLAANARRLEQLGVDEAAAADAVGRIRAALPFGRDDGPALLGRGGQAVPHLLHRAALLGLCVQDLDRRFSTLTLPGVDLERAREELARRYAVAHAHATVADLAAWSGLPKRDLRPLPDGAAQAASGGEPVPPRLLPPFDPYVLGFKDRAFAVPAVLHAQVFPGGGMFRATAVDDGLVRGTWTQPRGRVALDPPGLRARFAEEVGAVEAGLS
jgi:hypothetical protein